ncbi:hypothetical protein [Sediminitomix flava]|uniref:Uncharacterized protein n=1 Tax=Sediminitomix flava TaxID=379075 RepID=A0A315ZJ27_SEDFL|nr:hypothetical protein [Sediminitomix flava]PWJ44838.1 hypothetical protein BC781_1011217 [Sediminitomix flava]
MKKVIIPFIAVILVSGLVFAQKRERRGMSEEVKNYIKENVWPVVSEQRQKFDSYLSTDEKAEIEALRARIEKLKEERKANRPQKAEKGKRPELTEAQREQMHASRKEMKRIMYSAFQIAENHESELSSLMSESKDDREKWRKDLSAMKEAKREEMKSSEKGEKENKGRKGRKHHHGKMGHGPRGMNIMHPSEEMFILFDYNKSADDFFKEMEEHRK